MKDYFRFIIFLAIFTAGFCALVRTGTQRLSFDDAGIGARIFLHTVCRMGEVSRGSLTTFLNYLPKGEGLFDVRIECRHESGDGTGEIVFGNDMIMEGVNSNGSFKFTPGDEISIELTRRDQFFLCRGRVNGVR